jgi:uncharacterized protein YfiM (DUF2279 family)
MSTPERQQERTRIEAILTSSHAAGRAELAQHLAFKTDTPADAATKILASAAAGGRVGATVGALAPEELAKRINAESGIGARNERQASAVAGGALSADELARRVSGGA